jgi:acyl-CoA thioester hydrolase
MDQTPYRRRINYYETDQMAVVHHSNYIRFFEEARVDFLRRNGLDFAKMEGTYGIMFPVLDVSCKYVKSARLDQELLFYVKLRQFTGVRITLDYDVRFAEDGSQCAQGTTVLGILNKDYMPISIKRKLPEIYQQFMRVMEEQNALENEN